MMPSEGMSGVWLRPSPRQEVMTRAALIGGIALTLSAGTAFVYRETRHRESDRHAIVAHLKQMERAIRAHDAGLWLHVVTTHPALPGDRNHEAMHESMLRDFERLQHLDDLQITDIAVELADDTAVARYRIWGEGRRGDAAPPTAGELRFVRGPAGWEMTSHKLFE